MKEELDEDLDEDLDAFLSRAWSDSDSNSKNKENNDNKIFDKKSCYSHRCMTRKYSRFPVRRRVQLQRVGMTRRVRCMMSSDPIVVSANC